MRSVCQLQHSGWARAQRPSNSTCYAGRYLVSQATDGRAMCRCLCLPWPAQRTMGARARSSSQTNSWGCRRAVSDSTKMRMPNVGDLARRHCQLYNTSGQMSVVWLRDVLVLSDVSVTRRSASAQPAVSKNASTSDLSALSRPSVVICTPSAVFIVISTLASNAVEYAFGLQNTSKCCSSFASGSPAASTKPSQRLTADCAPPLAPVRRQDAKVDQLLKSLDSATLTSVLELHHAPALRSLGLLLLCECLQQAPDRAAQLLRLLPLEREANGRLTDVNSHRRT